jgi:hypothetical protein
LMQGIGHGADSPSGNHGQQNQAYECSAMTSRPTLR